MRRSVFFILSVMMLGFLALVATGATISSSSAALQLTTLQGRLTVIYAEDFRTGYMEILFFLATPDGQEYQLALTEEQVGMAGGINKVTGAYVTVQIADSLRSGVKLNVVSLSLDTTRAAEPRVAGVTNWVNLLCKYSNVATEPATVAEVDAYFDTAYPLMGHYWNTSSYNTISLPTVDTFGWFTLPNPDTFYNGSNLPHCSITAQRRQMQQLILPTIMASTLC